MENKIKFFDEIFRVLLFITLSAWTIYILFLLFVGDSATGCVAGPPSSFLNGLALVAGVLSAPPLVYGLVRLFLWPDGPKLKRAWVAGWVIGGSVAVFIIVVIVFAFAVSQFGCH